MSANHAQKSAVFPLMWFTSHTPKQDGQRICAMKRWLGNHAGHHGTGYRRKSLSVPLSTGTGLHTGLQLLGEWLLEYQQSHGGATPVWPQDGYDVIGWAAEEAATRYEHGARRKGFTDSPNVPRCNACHQLLSDPPCDHGHMLEWRGLLMQDPAMRAVEDLILEQRTLIEGMIWTLALYWLPALLQNYRILHVEREETIVRECTCGLGEAISWWELHNQRGCRGVVQQGREDWIVETLDHSRVSCISFKSKSSERLSWEKAFEHSDQNLLNMEAAERRIGRPVTECYVVVAFKGWLGRDKGSPPDAPKYQHSPLCYGFFDPGSPGLRPSAWAPKGKWWDNYGKQHSLARTYTRVPLWERPDDRPMPEIRPGASRMESWIRGYITPQMYADLFKVLGPFPKQTARMSLALKALDAEEYAWRGSVDQAREIGIFGPADAGSLIIDDKGTTKLVTIDDLIPRSWNCTNYDNSECEFKWLCDRNPGWEDPVGSGRYEIRTPHHAPEKQAFEAVGVKFPTGEDDLPEDGDE